MSPDFDARSPEVEAHCAFTKRWDWLESVGTRTVKLAQSSA
jgi:hypothetical protein